MPLFRTYWLDAEDRIISGDYIEAMELSGALDIARASTSQHPGGDPDRIEVWLDADRMWPPSVG